MNKAAVQLLAKEQPTWNTVLEGIEITEKILNIRCVPHAKNEKQHARLSLLAARSRGAPARLGTLITAMGKLRRSLG